MVIKIKLQLLVTSKSYFSYNSDSDNTESAFRSQLYGMRNLLLPTAKQQIPRENAALRNDNSLGFSNYTTTSWQPDRYA
jgi:hypothetical protein